MGSLNTLLVVAAVLDPAVVLAIWTLACLAALAVGLGIAWAVQIQGDGDPFARRRPSDVGDLSSRHAAADRQTRHQPRHTIAAVAARLAAEAVAEPGQHHTGERRLVASLIDTQPISRATIFAAIDDYAERAA